MPTKRKRVVPPKPGDRFGRLTVLRGSLKKGKDGSYTKACVCRCDCGNEIETPIYPLLRGRVVSCGCRLRERMGREAGEGRFRAQRRNPTGYKGVTKGSSRSGGPWIAQIVVGYKPHRKCARSAIEAARLYDEMAIEFRGPTASLNFPEEHPEHPNREPARRTVERRDGHAH